jgi:hypothetical protein
MKKHLHMIISGGQTGVDLAGLEAGNITGIPTGGCAPKEYKTEEGSSIVLKTRFGLYESRSSKYPDRTKENIEKSDCTLIIYGKVSKGSTLSKNLCEKSKKPYLYLESDDVNIETKIKEFVSRISAIEGRKIVVNVAGNRESVCPGIRTKTREMLIKCIEDDRD